MSKNTFEKLFPVLVLGLGLVYFLMMFLFVSPYSAAGFDFDGYAALPCQDGGRIKPLDTSARTTLMVTSGKQTFADHEDHSGQPAIRWMLDVMTFDPTSPSTRNHLLDYKVFRIENDQVLSLLGLQPRSRFRYSIEEFRTRIKELTIQGERVRRIPDKDRDLYDTKIAELDSHMGMFFALTQHKTPPVVPPLAGALSDTWQPLAQFGPEEAAAFKKDRPAAYYQSKLLEAYQRNSPANFNRLVAEYRQYLDQEMPGAAARARFEVLVNRLQPFHYAAEFYVYALILGVLSWMGWSRPLNRAGLLLMVFGLLIHTFGLVSRMYIQDRPFVWVTNLYSSAIFIGWGCAAFCLFIECIFPRSLAMVSGCTVAAITGIIGHHLSMSGDTLEMMQAVLDTNFWLATHVTCVTLGYTATFLAGFLGILYVILGVFTPELKGDTGNVLAKMIYGVACFATLLSFTGTVLGGIWADYSWGRFWGWDPKENGALLIVIWNALLLHARWGGVVKQRGMALLAIAGNMVTAWSWFGTNMLGVGLHSYGKMGAAFYWLLAFDVLMLCIIGIGMIPQKNWISFQQGPPRPPGDNGALPTPPRRPLASTAISTSS